MWDPRFISEREHRKRKVLCAAELALNERTPGNLHTVNDAIKLAGPTNEIRYGYLIFFVRDDPDYKKNIAQVREHLNAAAKKVRVMFAQVDGKRKPRPEYLGSWGSV